MIPTCPKTERFLVLVGQASCLSLLGRRDAGPAKASATCLGAHWFETVASRITAR